MKVILAIIAFVFVAAGASAQVIYSSIRIPVESGTTCPANWTSQSESVTTPTIYVLRVPASIGGRDFPVTPGFANLIWPTAADKAAAVAAGILAIQASTTTDRFYCALLPSP